MLNLGRLEMLCEVVTRGSFSAAAEALSYTQSAVSQAIARLEAETGATLVVRGRRGVRPTAAGSTLVEHAEAIFAQVEAAEADLAAVLGVRAGRLRVASFPSAGATLMPLAVATFRERHPDVTLTLAEGEPEEIAPRLRAGEFDLALLFEFPGAREPAAGAHTSVTLLEDPMYVALREDHPLASKVGLSLADLGDEQWVQTSASSPCARHVVRSCLAAGFEPVVTFESDDYETIQGLVAAGGADSAARADPGAPRDHRAPARAAQPGPQGGRGDNRWTRRRTRGEGDGRCAERCRSSLRGRFVPGGPVAGGRLSSERRGRWPAPRPGRPRPAGGSDARADGRETRSAPDRRRARR
jgi:DNA-binding transcriptional LysR family regulator